MNPYRRIAELLTTDPKVILDFDIKMKEIAIEENTIERILEENDKKITKFLDKLGLTRDVSAEELSRKIYFMLKRSEDVLFSYLGRPDFSKKHTINKLINTAKELVPRTKGFFLKKEVARKLLIKAPPFNILKYFGYSSSKELVDKENIYQIYPLLRIVEEREWMNNIFLKEYDNLTPADFEEREIEIIVLEPKWRELFIEFAEKKYHHLSHLKELGIIFILPLNPEGRGAWLRDFTLILHYLYEIKFYSKLFKLYFNDKDFSRKLQYLLKGEMVSKEKLEELKIEKNPFILIVQRYLAKEDKSDPRIKAPHINPEAIHWEKAEDELFQLSKKVPGLNLDLFEDCDFVGDYFKSENEGRILISFDLVDNIMGLVKEKEMIKYLYHQQEALWNKIISIYIGEKKLEKLLLENFTKGYIIFE